MSYAIAPTDDIRNIELQQWRGGYEELVGGLTYQMKWKRFKETVRRCGFQIGYLRKFEGHGWSYKGESISEEEIICYNRKNGMVLYANSFGGTAINQATIYGEVDYSRVFNARQKALVACCRTIKKSADTLSFSMEVGKGFEFYVLNFEKNFKFCTPWTVAKDLIFANYMERENSEKSFWETCTRKKMEQCNSELRAIMCK